MPDPYTINKSNPPNSPRANYQSPPLLPHCTGAEAMLFMKPNGEINRPCAVGPNPDCENCGNFMHFMVHSALKHISLQKINNLRKHFT